MKTKSIFDLMGKEGLTTLEIFYYQRENKFLIRGMKEWDDDLQFSKYSSDFTHFDVLTEDYEAAGTKKMHSCFKKAGLGDYLELIEQLIRDGRHDGIEFFYHRRKNIRVTFCKHSVITALGNRQHAIRAGAMRRHELDAPEIDVIMDGLNLSRAMTYKNTIASIPYGGCKTVIQCDPVQLDDFETMGFLSYVVDRCRKFAGADTLATSYVLSHAIQKIGDYDMIFSALAQDTIHFAKVFSRLTERFGEYIKIFLR